MTCQQCNELGRPCPRCRWVDMTGPHGEHYAAETQPVDLIDANGWGDHWDRACIVKYVTRAGRKGDAAADLAKAAWHLERMRERL